MLGVAVGHYLVLSAVLFAIGMAGVLTRRNAIVLFMCIEIMLNAAKHAINAFAMMHQDLGGHLFAFMVIAVAAAEAGIGLAIIMNVFRHRRALNVDELNSMRH